MTAKRKCSGTAYEVTGFHRCFRNATVERDGQWWCWQHDPERVEAKAIKRMTTWQSEQNRLDAMYIRNARLGPLVTEELAELLERLAQDSEDSSWGDGCDHEGAIQARATAARIREALEVTDGD